MHRLLGTEGGAGTTSPHINPNYLWPSSPQMHEAWHTGCWSNSSLDWMRDTSSLCEPVTNQTQRRFIEHWDFLAPSSALEIAQITSIFCQSNFSILPAPDLDLNSNGLCITSTSMSEIVGNPDLLWVKLAQPWLACLSNGPVLGIMPQVYCWRHELLGMLG